tara:strand:- start:20 stop:391 length:372 start_codon:yes stop_codon:yes gene_type:complete
MSKRILTIDDATNLRKRVKFILESVGYEVIEAECGEVAVAFMQKETVDLILCDINMPGIDGFETTRQIKALPNGSGVPILQLTTETDPATKASGRASGGIGWIMKPFKPETLIEVANKTLAKD